MKKDKQRCTKHHTETYRSSNTNPITYRAWTQALQKGSRSCSTSGTHRVTLVCIKYVQSNLY